MKGRSEQFCKRVNVPSLSSLNKIGAEGKIGWALLWLIGIPLPLLLVLYYLIG